MPSLTGRTAMPNPELEKLLERAKGVSMTPEEKEKQRQSFAYGTTKIENPRISRDSIKQAAAALGDQHGSKKG